MKIKIVLALIALAVTVSCSKNNNIEPDENINSKSTSVYYVDTFRIYSTDLTGSNRKLVVDENINSGNNYISKTAVLPVSGQIVYVYITGYQDPKTIKIVNADGSGKKILKTIPAGTDVAYLKSIDKDRIYYCTYTPGNNSSEKLFSMNADGGDEKEIKLFLNPVNYNSISKSGNDILAGNYLMKFKDGVFLEAQSFNVFTTIEISENYSVTELSPDGKKLAYIKKTSKNNEFDLMVKDVEVKNGSATKILTCVVSSELVDDAQYTAFFDIDWLNTSDKVILSYSKFTFPKGSPNDYTKCELVDLPAAKITASWNFIGDDATVVIN